MVRKASLETPCSCAALRRTARQVTQAYDQALRPSGLRLTQFSLLANLARRDGLSVTELAALLAMDRTTLTRNLQPLVRRGWISIAAGADRRSRAVLLTDAGRQAHKAALPHWRAAEKAFRLAMGPSEAADLNRLLGQAMTGSETMG